MPDPDATSVREGLHDIVLTLSRILGSFELDLKHFELILDGFDRFETFFSKPIAYSGP